MKKLFLILGTFLLSLSTYAAMNVNKIDPPFWYAGMQNPELQLMVYGEDIGNSSVTVNYPGVSLSSTVRLCFPKLHGFEIRRNTRKCHFNGHVCLL